MRKINEHDAHAVARFYTNDAIDISPRGIVYGRQAIERRLAEEFKTIGTDFSETIDEAHISGNIGWWVGHWSVTRVIGRARSRIKGYVAAVLERRNGFWKARLHVTGTRPISGAVEQ